MNAPRPRVNRRDLFRLRRTANALRPTSEAADSGLVSSGNGTSLDLLRASRPAMGSWFEIRLAANTPGALGLAERAFETIDALEAQLTVYQDDSEVCRLNASAHRGPIAVEAGLFDLLRRAVALSAETDGAYDVTAGALSDAWGFVRGPRRVPDDAALNEARSRTGWRHLILDPDQLTVAFDRPGLTINLGSIGKGHAIDRAVDRIREYWWPTTALIHGGRSSLFALGSPPGRFGGRWQVALRNPFVPETPIGMLSLRNRGIGTSGASFQQFEADGRIYGHIIDPRTGVPALGPASVTVFAPSAAEADALSTAFYLLGLDGTAAYVEKHPEIGVVFVLEGAADRSPRIATFGLGDADFTHVSL